jgi:hypothetical protein
MKKYNIVHNPYIFKTQITNLKFVLCMYTTLLYSLSFLLVNLHSNSLKDSWHIHIQYILLIVVTGMLLLRKFAGGIKKNNSVVLVRKRTIPTKGGIEH